MGWEKVGEEERRGKERREEKPEITK